MTVVLTPFQTSSEVYNEPVKLENVRMVSAYPHNDTDGISPEIIVYFMDYTHESFALNEIKAFTMIEGE